MALLKQLHYEVSNNVDRQVCSIVDDQIFQPVHIETFSVARIQILLAIRMELDG